MSLASPRVKALTASSDGCGWLPCSKRSTRIPSDCARCAARLLLSHVRRNWSRRTAGRPHSRRLFQRRLGSSHDRCAGGTRRARARPGVESMSAAVASLATLDDARAASCPRAAHARGAVAVVHFRPSRWVRRSCCPARDHDSGRDLGHRSPSRFSVCADHSVGPQSRRLCAFGHCGPCRPRC